MNHCGNEDVDKKVDVAVTAEKRVFPCGLGDEAFYEEYGEDEEERKEDEGFREVG